MISYVAENELKGSLVNLQQRNNEVVGPYGQSLRHSS